MSLQEPKLARAVATLILLAAHGARANNGDQMVGYSGLSNGMGGAVVATPQDGTTALTNPAGLSFVDMAENAIRFDMNLGLFNPRRELNGVQSANSLYVMAIGGLAFRTAALGDRLTFAAGAYPVSGGGVDFPTEAFTIVSPAGATHMSIVAGRQSLRIGPAVALRVTSSLSVGANLSLAVNTMSLKGPTGNFPSDTAYGWSGVVGATWQIASSVRLGAAYTARTRSQSLEWSTDAGRYGLAFEDPQAFAAGLSFQPSPKWLVEVDVKYLDYASVRDQLVLDAPDGMPDITLGMGWESQWVYAVGAKVEVLEGMSLLAGYNYGKAPIDPADVRANVGAMAVIEHHGSLGAELDVSEHSTLTLSVIRGFSNSMSAPQPGPVVDVAFEANLVTLQFTYRG